MSISRPSFIVRTKQKVVREISAAPIVGFENTPDLPDGWQYDVKRWASPFDLRLPVLPKIENTKTQGVPEEYFLSGVSDTNEDIFLKSIEQITNDKTKQWIPIITTGDYYRYNVSYHLFSDNSIVQYANPVDNLNSANYITLDKQPNINSDILVASFKREKHINTIVYHKKLSKVNKFTGIYVDGVEQDTLPKINEIAWDEVDRTKREFILSYPNEDNYVLITNKDYIEQHGVVPTVYQDLGACEYVGSSNGQEYQVFTLRYFPILADSSFRLYVANNSTYEEWNRIDSWWELFNTGTYTSNKYYLDKDLGIIYFGNSSCGIPVISSKIVLTYKSTIRIEYEEESINEPLVAAFEADVNPITQGTSQGFVCITHKIFEAANINLTINKSKVVGLSPEQYGPVYVGSDYGVLTANISDMNGDAISGVEVSFSLVPNNIGTLNNSIAAISATNSLGKAYASYQPPSTSDDLGWYSKTIEDNGSTKDIVIKIPEAGLSDKEKIFVYHVLKDDPILGYDSLDTYLDAIYAAEPVPWVENSSDPDAKDKWKAEMINEYNLKSWVQSDEGAIPFGRKVILYKIDYSDLTSAGDNFDSQAINPITGSAGAVMPVFPTTITKDGSEWKLTYPAAAIPDIYDPDTNPTSQIAGYWMISDRIVSVQASCWSPYYNRTIYSNALNIRVAVPDYMLGVYVNDQLKSIPFGWKIKNEDIISSTINTTTFITINPHSGPYEIIDLVNGGTTDTWASAPFRTVNFIFNIQE